MDAIKQGGTNSDEIQRISEKITSMDNNLLENNGQILQISEQLSSVTGDLEDATIALNTEMIAIQENMNSTLNQLDQQRFFLNCDMETKFSLASPYYCLNPTLYLDVKFGKLSWWLLPT